MKESVLLVPPIGSVPWVTVDDLAEEFEKQGYSVVVDDMASPVVGRPVPYTPTTPFSVTRLGLIVDRVRAYAAWARRTRGALTRLRPAHVFVWSGNLAALIRVLRPRGTTVTWVVPDDRIYNRRALVLRALEQVFAERLIVSRRSARRFSTGREVLVDPPRPARPEDTPQSNSAAWVVLIGAERPSPAALNALTRLAHDRPAQAVVVDGRRNDAAVADVVDAVQKAADAKRVLYALDTTWPGTLEIGVAYDVGPVLRDDHRHWSALGGGVTLLAWTDSLVALDPRLGVGSEGGEWRRVEVAGGVEARSLDDWCRQALPASRAAAISAEAKPLEACPRCASPTRRRAHDAGDGITVWRCGACGLRYSSHQVPATTLYASGYHDADGTFGPDYANPTTLHAAAQAAESRLDFLEQSGVRPGRLLDIGAGLGQLVAAARRRGWDAAGLEFSASAASYARSINNVELAIGDLESASFDEQFDVVTICQTLEHLAEPRRALDLIARMLKPNGVLFVEVPNVASAARVLQRRRWLLWQPGDHVLHLDKSALRGLLVETGFRVQRLDSDSSLYDTIPGLNIALHLGLISAQRLIEPSYLTIKVADLYNNPIGRRALVGAARVVDKLGGGHNLVALARRA